jgi:hypothetical protein
MKYKRYQIKHIFGMDRYLHILETIREELGNYGFRHIYIEDHRLFLLKKEEEMRHELARKLKEKGLVLKFEGKY